MKDLNKKSNAIKKHSEAKNKTLKELEQINIKYEQLLKSYDDLMSKYKELERDSLVYKASHEKLVDTKKIQDLLQRKEQELILEKKYACKTFISDILEPFELFEQSLSIKNVPEAVKNWLIGFEMILNKFKNVLSQHGVSEINPNVNSDLNASLHEVIEEVNSPNVNSGKIAQVVRKGYLLHDRVIKYAQVKTQENKHK